MALNPYFLNGTSGEQRLIQDLVNEQLRMFGQEVVYMPRKFITEKKIIKELLVSKFDDSFHLEAYISTADGFGGQGDILSKFGVRSTDEITFIISKERFEDFISPFILNQTDIKLTTRPQEGDLIYLPLDNGLFEIKYVEAKRPFYQLNNLYVYELKCELFEYEDEIIDTGLEEVDKAIQDFGYIMTLNMVPRGTRNAQISVELSRNQIAFPFGNSISYIDIINSGYGYREFPEVKIDKAPPGGVDAIAHATLIERGGVYYIDKILIENPGIGYTEVPKVSVKSKSGSGFIGTCVMSDGVLGPINIIDGGSNYSDQIDNTQIPIFSYPSNPDILQDVSINLLRDLYSKKITNKLDPFPINDFIEVHLRDGSVVNATLLFDEINSKLPSISNIVSISTSPTGNNAEAIAYINPTNGTISSILYTNAGSGYTSNPIITISPSVGISTGNYIYNEIVRGVSTGTSAYVKNWDGNTKTLKVSIVNGNFGLGEVVVGTNASHKIYSIVTDDIYEPYASNDEIEEEADQILDFSETNPFGNF